MLCCRSATQWAGLGQFAVLRSPMSSMKIDGASLSAIRDGQSAELDQQVAIPQRSLERDLSTRRGEPAVPSGAFVARSFPSDTSMETPYRPAPEQSHAG